MRGRMRKGRMRKTTRMRARTMRRRSETRKRKTRRQRQRQSCRGQPRTGRGGADTTTTIPQSCHWVGMPATTTEGLETPGQAESPHAGESMTRKAETTRRSTRRVDEEEKEG